MTRRVAVLATVGTAIYAAALAIAATSDTGATSEVVSAFAAGFSFTVTGVIAVARRPENRTGMLMLFAGWMWALGVLTLTDSPVLFTIGAIGQQLAFVPLAHLLLAFPTGVLERRSERRIVGALWLTVFTLPLLLALVDRTPTDCTTCPDSAIVVRESHVASVALQIAFGVVAIGLVVAVVVQLARKYRAAGPPLRRVVTPVYAAFASAVVFLVASNALTTVSSVAATTSGVIAVVFIALVPVAFLAGLLRSRLARGSVLPLLVALESGTPLRDAIAEALGDPSLEIGYRLSDGDRWVDARGRPVAEPTAGGGRSVTTVDRHGERIAAFLHDASLDEEPDIVRGVAAAAALALEAQRAQAELRSQYAYLTTLVDTTPSLLVSIGLDGRILSGNGAVVEAAGYEREEEIRGRFFWDVFIVPEMRDAMRARFEAAAPEHPAAEYEDAFANARGEERVIFWRSAPVLNAEGRVVSIVAGGLDVSERHRLEADKQREHDFFIAMLNATPSFICIVDHEGRVSYRGVNAAFAQALEWSDLDVEGRVFWEDWVAAEDAETVRKRIEMTVAGDSLGAHDNVWVTRAGRRLTVAWTCTPLPPLDERTLFLITGVDVTERRRREEETRAAEERLRAVVENAPIAIVELGLDDRVGLWNPAAERIFGWTADEVLGRPPVWVPADLQGDFRALSDREALGDGYTGHETVRLRKDGTRIDVEISAAPIRDAAGAIVGAMAVIGDISDRRRQEAEVRASRARIVQAADDARRKLERNLHDGAQQRLVALSIALRLAEGKLTPDPDAAAPILAEARDELALALAELRELARGLHPAVVTDRGLPAALDALAERSPVPVERHVQLERRLPQPVEVALYYVASEALANVAKYAQASSATVRLTDEGDQVTISISDDGVGGADPGAGSGLRGLADRVAALDGHIELGSRPGGGTRIVASVPVAKVREAVRQDAGSPHSA
jgi:PAS domain S-box-containing protein